MKNKHVSHLIICMIFLIYCLPEDSVILGYNAVSMDNLTHVASYLRREKSSV